MREYASLLRYVSPFVLGALLGCLFWLAPGLAPQSFGAVSPERTVLLMSGLFIVFIGYLQIQGHPISHGDIGTPSSHTVDSIVSWVPAIVALFGIFLSLLGFKPLSQLNLSIAGLTLAVVWLDLWIYGGAAAKINRLTDEIKAMK